MASSDGTPRAARRVRGPRWWREFLYIAVFYALYSVVRDIRGTKPVTVFQAFTNARRIIRLERFAGIFHEQAVQSWFLGWHWLLRFLDDFYGSMHFIVTIAAMLYLFFRRRQSYALWRNVLAVTTALDAGNQKIVSDPIVVQVVAATPIVLFEYQLDPTPILLPQGGTKRITITVISSACSGDPDHSSEARIMASAIAWEDASLLWVATSMRRVVPNSSPYTFSGSINPSL